MENIKQKLKKIVKYFDVLINKILLKYKNKINNIIKYFNTLIKKTLLKHKIKKKSTLIDNYKISFFNKSLIVLISTLFIYLFYLSIPTLYDKTWVQNTIEKKLFKNFKINFSFSSDISYEILPSPHFLVKNAKIYANDADKPKQISEIKELKIFISQNNFFNKEKLEVQKILIDRANFSLQLKDFIYLNKLIDKKFSRKIINIKNSKIFFKDNANETISIIKISKFFSFYNDLKFVNIVDVKGNIFNLPFAIELNKEINKKLNHKELIVDLKILKLRLEDKSRKFIQDGFNATKGKNILYILNSKLVTQYEYLNDLVSFQSTNSNFSNSKIDYKGKLFIDPFDLILDIVLEDLNLNEWINPNSIFLELLKAKLLFNENISANISIKTKNNFSNKFFNFGNFIFNIDNGKIDFNQSTLINNKIGSLKLSNSNLLVQNDDLKFIGNFKFDIKDSDNFYSFILTPKKSRKPIKNITMRVEYDFIDNKLSINTFQIDGKEQVKINKDLFNNLHNLQNERLKNYIQYRNLFNKLLSVYEG